MNLKDILQNAPRGLLLFSDILGDVTFDEVKGDDIVVYSKSGTKYHYDSSGRFKLPSNDSEGGICTLWPRNKKPNWEGWQKILLNHKDIIAPINKDDHRLGIISNVDTIYLSDGQKSSGSLLDYRYATFSEVDRFWREVAEHGLKWDDKSDTFISESDKWKFKKDRIISGYWIDNYSRICSFEKHQATNYNENTFSRVEYAVSCLAMAQLSQIIENDPRFGGMITSNEWNDALINKYVITRESNQITTSLSIKQYTFLAFHTREQRDLFLEENKELIKNYLMIK